MWKWGLSNSSLLFLVAGNEEVFNHFLNDWIYLFAIFAIKILKYSVNPFCWLKTYLQITKDLRMHLSQIQIINFYTIVKFKPGMNENEMNIVSKEFKPRAFTKKALKWNYNIELFSCCLLHFPCRMPKNYLRALVHTSLVSL